MLGKMLNSTKLTKNNETISHSLCVIFTFKQHTSEGEREREKGKSKKIVVGQCRQY